MKAVGDAGRRRSVPAGFFALRTPLLPFEAFLRPSDPLSAPAALSDPDALARALALDREALRGRLRGLLARPEVREALFLASPDLYDALGAWEAGPESQKGARVERGLVKYVSRMSGRPTPFGLFAGSSLGRVGERTRFVVEERTSHQRHSRLDFDYLFALADAIARDPARRSALRYRPNSSLYELADRWRYVEVSVQDRARTYRLVAIEDSPALRDTLARAAQAATIPELASALVDEDVSLPEAEAFVVELVDAQVLVPQVGLHLTGREPAGVMVDELSGRPETRDVAEALSRAIRSLEELDTSGACVEPGRYRSVAAELSGLPAPPEIGFLFQVDVVTATRATLGGTVLEEVERAVAVAQRLLLRSGRELTAFRDAFLERYEQREVPLVEALDEESGIGFPAYAGERTAEEPLLSDLPFPAPPGDGRTRWGKRERFLLRKAAEAWSSGATEIVLLEKDVDEIATEDADPLPGSFAAVAVVCASSDDALDRGDFRLVLTGLDGPSGACLLGRFCHADPSLRGFVEQHLRQEEALEPDAVFAELVHLPQTRAGNVLLRPVLRELEIPYLGGSGAPRDRQVPVTDLLVSVVDQEVRLRSRRLGKRLIPRLTTAHDYSRGSLGLYRFLGELQGQRVAAGRPWYWGPIEDAPFLPRVRYGRVVLAPARWTVGGGELARLAPLAGTERYRAAQAWRAERRIPRLVVVADDDSDLPFDLDNVLSLDAFVQIAAGRETTVLHEMLAGPGQLCARGPDGSFVHELVIPFVGAVEAPSRLSTPSPVASGPARSGQPSAPAALAALAARRSFPPGSEWMTAKLYSGVATADRLLLGTLRPLVAAALEDGILDSWFFLRYADPRPHIRLRLHGEAGKLTGALLPELAAVSESSPGAVWKLQLDTYEREVERYGGPEAIALAEEVFFADSEAVLEILDRLEEGPQGTEERWRLALRGIDALLDDLGLDLTARRALAERQRRDLCEELGADASVGRALGRRYRELSGELEGLLDPSRDAESPLAPGIEVLRARSGRLAPAVGALGQLDREGRLSAPLAEVAASLVHMHVNRMLRSDHRRQEYVLYDFLCRLYASRAARSREEASRPGEPRGTLPPP